jgi:hypothetical protein
MADGAAVAAWFVIMCVLTITHLPKFKFSAASGRIHPCINLSIHNHTNLAWWIVQVRERVNVQTIGWWADCVTASLQPTLWPKYVVVFAWPDRVVLCNEQRMTRNKLHCLLNSFKDFSSLNTLWRIFK